MERLDVRYLDAAQVAALIASSESDRDKALLATVYQCGLRRSEVQYLTRDDYSPSKGMLRVVRAKKRLPYVHEVALWPQTKRLLNRYLKSRTDYLPPLFLGEKTGNAIGGQGVYYVFLEAMKRAGIAVPARNGRGLGPHSLRHSIAVHSMNFGLPIEDIRDHLGHDSIDSTLVYAKVLSPRKLRNALLTQGSYHFAKF